MVREHPPFLAIWGDFLRSSGSLFGLIADWLLLSVLDLTYCIECEAIQMLKLA